ncbi:MULTISPECIES: bifunctional diguanylate cyclase/phosphodiesterase [unclassified Marinobacter]|uniref:bifunctional diguanylate cyclase/phosphodiesterase n=1 Tax=unclassified Marinobacter TaxID=83889 RepID=UPI0019290CE3|nr:MULTISPECIES: EAL domain-containing protein [unclassified Marinobacter]MBL3823928.1 EAL domain-containing protein [Marinobacter sp. MC3]MBL3892084.1 EAL domain-containing protein [Marinobacter sp. MW3]
MVEAVTRDQRELVYRLSLSLARSRIDELDGSIQKVIAELGTHLKADRSYLVMLEEATQTASITHEICSPGTSPQRDAIQNVPMERFPWLAEQLDDFPVVVIPDVEKLPDEANEEKLEFRRQGIRSLILIGIKLEGQLAGVLGFDFLDRSETPDAAMREFLVQLGDVLGSSVHRQILAGRNARYENSLYRYSDQFPGVIFQFRIYPDGRVTFPFLSKKVEIMFGLAVDTLRPDARPLLELIHHDDKAGFLEKVEESRLQMTPFETDFRAFRKDGSAAWIEARSVPARLADNSTIWHGYFYDVTDRKQSESEIEKLAFYDPLTGLPNRRLLRDRLAQALTGSTRDQNHGALVFIDLDNFKNINDSAGHLTGDELLIQVGQRLKQTVREWDTVARLGGDEFVLILKGFPADAANAAARVEKVCEKVRDALNEPYDLNGIDYTGTPSIGVTLFFDHDTSLEELLSQADMAMFRAKEDGRNCIRFYDSMMQKKVSERLAMESDLRLALRKNQLAVHYQVLVDEKGKPVGAEALLRWHCPGRGMVSPAEFIPLAEETGLIESVGYWVLEEVLSRVASWKKRAGALSQLQVSVNVSARQFHLPSFCSTVMALLRKTGASPRNLKVEITESALAYDLELVEETLRTLRSMGIRISLDDFGTGYSSLGYLKRLSLDELKIDQGFVRDILDDPNDAAIAETILALASALRLSAVAEGVETKGQLERLVGMGCTRFQGYYFSRPLPALEFEGLIEKSMTGQQRRAW